jgi:hypothetical protein
VIATDEKRLEEYWDSLKAGTFTLDGRVVDRLHTWTWGELFRAGFQAGLEYGRGTEE